MKLVKTAGIVSLLLALIVAGPIASAATSPGIGAANTFNILSSSYSNTVGGTTMTGDLGYTTGPAVVPTVGGTTHVADSTYNQAGIDQGNGLSALSSQPCTFNFAPGPIDLASDTTHGPVGVYTPGVYCMTGATSIGGGGTISLTGGGTYIFRTDGTLTSSANSIVTLANGASACDIWWTPTQATTLGANSTFAGTDMDAAGITIGSLVTWQGQALAFGGTVSTASDTLTMPVCSATRGATPSAPLTTPGLPNTGTGALANKAPTMPIIFIASIFAIAVVGYVIGKKRYSL